jgi:hypothetical protein
MRKISRLTQGLMLIPILLGVISNAVFVAQGGFGAGHGKLDFVIMLLAIPWSLPASPYGDLPLPDFIKNHDVLLVVWLPALLNMVLLFLVGIAIDFFRRKQ